MQVACSWPHLDLVIVTAPMNHSLWRLKGLLVLGENHDGFALGAYKATEAAAGRGDSVDDKRVIYRLLLESLV